jgi:hypothetical protein
MTHQTPCSNPENDPDDWFIGRDGKQYADEDFLSEAEERGLARSVLPIAGESPEEHEERVNTAIRVATAERRRKALAARRHAREKCHTECYFRAQCLEQALDQDQQHGTWGGYYEEELREIRREIARRKRGRRTA